MRLSIDAARKLVVSWSDTMDITPPEVHLGKCKEHDLTDHYHDDHIFVRDNDVYTLFHEFTHHVISLSRRGILSLLEEESFVDLMMETVWKSV